MKVLISLRFIHNLEKTATSAGVFAFITTKVKNAHKIIKTTSNNTAKNHKILVIEIGSFLIFAFVLFTVFLGFKNIFSQSLLGAVLAKIFIFCSLKFISNSFFCSSSSISKSNFQTHFNFIKILA
jgi:hypothetical protein